MKKSFEVLGYVEHLYIVHIYIMLGFSFLQKNCLYHRNDLIVYKSYSMKSSTQNKIYIHLLEIMKSSPSLNIFTYVFTSLYQYFYFTVLKCKSPSYIFFTVLQYEFSSSYFYFSLAIWISPSYIFVLQSNNVNFSIITRYKRFIGHFMYNCLLTFWKNWEHFPYRMSGKKESIQSKSSEMYYI